MRRWPAEVLALDLPERPTLVPPAAFDRLTPDRLSDETARGVALDLWHVAALPDTTAEAVTDEIMERVEAAVLQMRSDEPGAAAYLPQLVSTVGLLWSEIDARRSGSSAWAAKMRDALRLIFWLHGDTSV